MNIGKLTIDLDAPSSNPVVKIVQKMISSVEGENASVAAGALVATVVLIGKQTGAFTKEDALAAVEASWESIETEGKCVPSA